MKRVWACCSGLTRDKTKATSFFGKVSISPNVTVLTYNLLASFNKHYETKKENNTLERKTTQSRDLRQGELLSATEICMQNTCE